MIALLLLVSSIAVQASLQPRPDFSGVWGAHRRSNWTDDVDLALESYRQWTAPVSISNGGSGEWRGGPFREAPSSAEGAGIVSGIAAGSPAPPAAIDEQLGPLGRPQSRGSRPPKYGFERKEQWSLERRNATTFRNIGPFRTAAWVTEIAVPDAPLHDHLYTIYAATRTGGLWKTTNDGMTWDADLRQRRGRRGRRGRRVSSNPNIVWMGTGEQANARSSYSGKGVFKSTDAGKTWQLRACPTRTTSRGSSFTRPIPRSSTSRRWGTCSRATKSAACSGPATAARRGRRCSTSTMAPARSTW